MRHFLLATIFSLTTGLVAAQTPAGKDNTLTPKEAADGWLLLFDGETTFGWDAPGCKVVDGALSVENTGKATVNIGHTMPFDQFELIFTYKQVQGAAPITFALKPLAGNSQRLELSRPAGKDWMTASVRRQGGKLIRSFIVPGPGNSSLLLKEEPSASGARTLLWECPADSHLLLKNVKLRPLSTTSLFNGKDLTGWKEFPGKKSKFVVIDGAINVTNGPGDLQTEGTYGNFILQLECISNGEHLNSGVFFRCRAGEYQNGYEAQVRNQFTKEPTQDYVIEVYDPRSHQLVEKKKMAYTAVDYGTGAIYRRQPARKEVAKDKEWFTLTVAAHANHFATWVNGIQVTDWYDNRPKSDNARTGFRLEPGHISFQGHDPTTNLSFRNIRIAELK